MPTLPPLAGVQAQANQYATKKYLFDLLQDKYQNHEKMIERLSNYLITEEDVRGFMQLAVDCFERGYHKAVKDYEKALNEMGYNVRIVPENKD